MVLQRKVIMGYYVTMEAGEFAIPETPEVLAALHGMDEKLHSFKRGGSFGGERESRHFSWMPESLKGFDSVFALFSDLGFECTTEDGFVHLKGYNNKTGQEELFLAIVAPFVADGSFIEWEGEDRAFWRNTVAYGKLMMVTGEKITQWDHASPITVGAHEYVDEEFITFTANIYDEEEVKKVSRRVEEAKEANRLARLAKFEAQKLAEAILK